MPHYELALLIKTMTRPELAVVLKRAACSIFEKGGIICRIDNLGLRPLPYKIKSHNLFHKKASYFVMEFISPASELIELNAGLLYDVDLVRHSLFKIEDLPEVDCTLEEECLPPAYRKEVQKMLEIANKKGRYEFKPNTGLDYYPFLT